MGGKIWIKFGGWYHATKFAAEGFSDCLRMELAPFGIDVVVVEPGGIKTDWGIIAARHLKETAKGGAYEVYANKAADGMIKNYSGNMLAKPELIAETVKKSGYETKTAYAISCRLYGETYGIDAEVIWGSGIRLGNQTL